MNLNYKIFLICFILLFQCFLYSPGFCSNISIHGLKAICIPEKPLDAELSTAELLKKKISELYGNHLKIIDVAHAKGSGEIYIGLAALERPDLITAAELERVKHDGYIIKAENHCIALSGYKPQGTIYAGYALLRKIGLKIYPWHYSKGFEIFTPLDDGMLRPFTQTSKPFFEYRDLLGPLDKGKFGGTIRKYSLGNFESERNTELFKNNGWLGWDHTAGFLIPIKKYYKSHPEYFSIVNGKRIPASTPNYRVSICMEHPDVRKISTKRASNWIEHQKNRRFFMISNGDSAECQAIECTKNDPLPDYYTDRLLRWVNHVAKSIKNNYPDKILFSLAYGRSIKPPIKETLEPNVRVLYAPWYFTSRASSAVGFDSPLNIKAMEEFMAWQMKYPGQVGIYDYPGSWVHGTATRVKFYAKNNVKWIYFNNPSGELLHWVISQLLWDPSQNVEALTNEFLDAFYGPAATVMKQYVQLRLKTIKKNSLFTKDVLADDYFLNQTQKLLIDAEKVSDTAELNLQTRIMDGIEKEWYSFLKLVHPISGKKRVDPTEFKKLLKHYINLNKGLLTNCQNLGFEKHLIKIRTRKFIKKISLFNINLENGNEPLESLFNEAFQLVDLVWNPAIHQMKEDAYSQHFSYKLNLADKKDMNLWSVNSSDKAMNIDPTIKDQLLGRTNAKKGISIFAPLSKFPVFKRINLDVHTGVINIKRDFNPPINTNSLRFISIFLHSSHPAPVSFYFNTNISSKKFRSDIFLHAGEQLVRVDILNFFKTPIDRPDNMIIKSMEIELWPQDNFYPYPTAQDVHLSLFDLNLNNQITPDLHPQKIKEAVWLTQFQPNVPFGDRFISDVINNYKSEIKKNNQLKPFWSNYINLSKGERFRSFTPYRITSPLYAIYYNSPEANPEPYPAFLLKNCIEKIFGVSLPIRNDGENNNCIIVGKAQTERSHQFIQEESGYLGVNGFMIKAVKGKVVIVGTSDQSTSDAILKYINLFEKTHNQNLPQLYYVHS